MLLPVVKASGFVANEPLLPFVHDARGSIASAGAVRNRADSFVDLRNRDRRCPFS